jgi:hypothetical protein
VTWLAWVGIGMLAATVLVMVVGALVVMWHEGARIEALFIVWLVAAVAFLAIGSAK